MQERHKNRKLYFDEQAYTTQKYVIPYIAQNCPITSDVSVLEIGCGEGGNLKPFMDLGCKCVGIDLNEGQIENARTYFADHPNVDNLELLYADIYDVHRDDFQFDVIMLRDVIEHIHNQEKFMPFLKQFMKPNGVVFFAFPPWYMPFGGHQQICQSKISKTPFLHILPKSWYEAILSGANESKKTIDDLLEIKDTGITIERFERIVKTEKFKVLQRDFFFINPNYEIKFKLKPRKTLPVFRHILYLRDFYTTAAYYLLQK